MPTPFSHLAVAQRLLDDQALPQACRGLLRAELGAFLLGSIAADARVGAGMPREHTHFYAYAQQMTENPWRAMLRLNPELWQPRTPAHWAFMMGYVAHLAMDETWSREMVAPHFVQREWGSQGLRFLMLHIILIVMDERDLSLLQPWQADALHSAQPDQWVAFITDVDLRAWQGLIYQQLMPGGVSETLTIFGARARKSPTELRTILDSDSEMQTNLWDNIPRSTLAQVEAQMYTYICESVVEYWSRSVLGA
ncbi:MAG: zinc dependent phospholipase C family protein [Armatimonadetes bacterium]|nr:zinc dependent phospholipase C family protein [Anaerolineae bacterium]